MRRIISIEGVEERHKGVEPYFRTYATLDDGSEVIGWGDDYSVGDFVESFYDATWDTHKMRHKPVDIA